jgi:hypothetical protein
MTSGCIAVAESAGDTMRLKPSMWRKASKGPRPLVRDVKQSYAGTGGRMTNASRAHNSLAETFQEWRAL